MKLKVGKTYLDSRGQRVKIYGYSSSDAGYVYPEGGGGWYDSETGYALLWRGWPQVQYTDPTFPENLIAEAADEGI